MTIFDSCLSVQSPFPNALVHVYFYLNRIFGRISSSYWKSKYTVRRVRSRWSRCIVNSTCWISGRVFEKVIFAPNREPPRRLSAFANKSLVAVPTYLLRFDRRPQGDKQRRRSYFIRIHKLGRKGIQVTRSR